MCSACMTHKLPLAALICSLFTLMLAPALPATAATGDVTVHAGSWSKKAYASSGTWKIVKNGEHHYVVLDSRFKTRNAPDLKLFLSKNTSAKLTGRNATSGAVRVAKLKSNKGAQRYRLPVGINPSDFKSLIIHCERYSKLWSAGTLR